MFHPPRAAVPHGVTSLFGEYLAKDVLSNNTQTHTHPNTQHRINQSSLNVRATQSEVVHMGGDFGYMPRVLGEVQIGGDVVGMLCGA